MRQGKYRKVEDKPQKKRVTTVGSISVGVLPWKRCPSCQDEGDKPNPACQDHRLPK